MGVSNNLDELWVLSISVDTMDPFLIAIVEVAVGGGGGRFKWLVVGNE